MAIQTNELEAVVQEHIIKEVPDALAREQAFASWLVTDGKKDQKGGLLIQFPIKLLENKSSGHISGSGQVTDINRYDQLQWGSLNWKYYYVNVNFTLEDFNIARGEEEIVDFMETKTEGAMEDSARELSVAFHGTSVGNPFLPEGLKDIVAASGTAYAGLTNTDYDTDATAITNNLPTVKYTPILTTDQTPNYANISKMITKLQARIKNYRKAKKMLGLMNQSVYDKYKVAVQNQQLFGFKEDLLAKTGFAGFTVNGIEFYLDTDVPGSQDGVTANNYVYIFPADIMRLYCGYGWGAASPFDGKVKMPNQAINSIQHYFAYNIICNNRRLIAVNKTFVA